jgi:D-threo-aldose 1-dehydrogenase
VISQALPTRVHARTGVRFTELCLGGAPLGNLYSAVKDETALATVEAAWAGGVRAFDTAPHYGLGLAERRLGLALAGRPREEFVVSTKVGRLLVDDPSGAGRRDPEGFDVPATQRRVWDFSRDGVRRSVEASLTRLGLDRVDVVYLHDPDRHWREAASEGYPALAELRDEGVVRAVGVGMNQTAMPARFVRETDIDLVMVAGRYTLLDRSAADELLPLALARGVGVVVAAPFNSGLLATASPEQGATYDYAPASAELLSRARDLALVTRVAGVPLPAAALRFPLRNPAVLSVAAGCRRPQEVREAIAGLTTSVPESLWTVLDGDQRR